jgi:hypothetical protein
MTTFDNRENAFEMKYAHDQEVQFKAMARRNKLLGLWAAEKMGISGAEADAYAKEVIKADFAEAGDEDVYRKVKGDLDAKSAKVSEVDVRRAMHDLLITAQNQVMTEIKS